MFTVKLIKILDEGEIWTNLSCPHYEVYRRKSGPVTLTIFKDHSRITGIEYQQGDGFDACFVENDAGKTIEHIKALVNHD